MSMLCILEYSSIDEGSEPILFVYFGVAAFCFFMSTVLFGKWRKKKTTPPKLLFLTFLSYSICIVVTAIGFLEVAVTREKRDLYMFSLAFSMAGIMISNVFLMLFAVDLFSIEMKYAWKYIIISILIGISLALPWNYYGITKENMPAGSFSIRPYTNAAMMLFGFITHLKIFLEANKISKRADDNIGKMGFKFIGYSQLCMILFLALLVADAVYYAISEELTGYTIFNYFAWGAAAFFFLFSYLGLIMPDWLKKRLGA